MSQNDRMTNTWIQRFIIFHLSSSLEELGENILYFYDDKFSETDNCNNECHVSEEAVKFAGLCRAIYSLPSSLQNAGLRPYCQPNPSELEKDDETKEVYFTTCTFVFVSLEENSRIVAVVQIPRQYSNQKNSSYGENNIFSPGGNPHAIRCMFEKSHTLFQLTHGGGIHCRLLSCDSSDIPEGISGKTVSRQTYDSNVCLQANERANHSSKDYTGRERLYQHKPSWSTKINLLYQGKRENLASQFPLNNASSHEHLKLDPSLLVKNHLRKKTNALHVLPIYQLRIDLSQYYDDFIHRMSSLHKINGGVGRCIVQSIPKPLNTLERIDRHFPAQVTSSMVTVLNNMLRTMIFSTSIKLLINRQDYRFENRYFNSSIATENKCFGASVFHSGRFLFSETNHPIINISCQEACMVYEFMTSYQNKLTSSNRKSSFFSDSSVTNLKDLNITDLKGSFLPPPPISRVSKYENITYITTNDLGKVWMLNISLPVEDIHSTRLNTYALMYFQMNFSFVIYLRLSREEEQELFSYRKGHANNVHCDSYQGKRINMQMIKERSIFVVDSMSCFVTDIFKYISSSLSKLDAYTQNLPISFKPTHPDYLGEPGTDIVYVDRSENLLVLLPRHIHRKHDTKNVRRICMPLLFQTKRAKQEIEDNQKVYLPLELHIDSDCRHFLAAHLSLKILLAFDDRFIEISQRNRMSQDEKKLRVDNPTLDMVQSCTFLPEGWTYCCVEKNKELYMLIDTDLYTTLAAVHDVTKQVKQRLSNEWIV